MTQTVLFVIKIILIQWFFPFFFSSSFVYTWKHTLNVMYSQMYITFNIACNQDRLVFSPWISSINTRRRRETLLYSQFTRLLFFLCYARDGKVSFSSSLKNKINKSKIEKPIKVYCKLLLCLLSNGIPSMDSLFFAFVV